MNTLKMSHGMLRRSVCMYVYMHVCMHNLQTISLYEQSISRERTNDAYTQIYYLELVNTCQDTYIHKYIHTYTHKQLSTENGHIYIHTYIHTSNKCMYVYIHTHTYLQCLWHMHLTTNYTLMQLLQVLYALAQVLCAYTYIHTHTHKPAYTYVCIYTHTSSKSAYMYACMHTYINQQCLHNTCI